MKVEPPDYNNFFAVAVQNQGTTPNPAALISAINVTYTDGISTIIVSDANSEMAGC